MTGRPPPPVRCPACAATYHPPPDLSAAGCAAACCDAAACPLRGGEPVRKLVQLSPATEAAGRFVADWNEAVRERAATPATVRRWQRRATGDMYTPEAD